MVDTSIDYCVILGLLVLEENGAREPVELVTSVETRDLEDEQEAKHGALALVDKVGRSLSGATCELIRKWPQSRSLSCL